MQAGQGVGELVRARVKQDFVALASSGIAPLGFASASKDQRVRAWLDLLLRRSEEAGPNAFQLGDVPKTQPEIERAAGRLSRWARNPHFELGRGLESKDSILVRGPIDGLGKRTVIWVPNLDLISCAVLAVSSLGRRDHECLAIEVHLVVRASTGPTAARNVGEGDGFLEDDTFMIQDFGAKRSRDSRGAQGEVTAERLAAEVNPLPVAADSAFRGDEGDVVGAGAKPADGVALSLEGPATRAQGRARSSLDRQERASIDPE